MTLELRMRLATPLLAASVLLALGPAGAWASVPVSGTLHAEKDCEAFVSKKKKSNPDKARLETGDSYVVLEMNRPEQPEWYRVRVDDANPPERWVEAGCGTLSLRDAPDVGEQPEPIRPDDPSLCSTAGLQDSFKLALSWQPAFCESHRNKKECGVSFPATFQAAGNFTLHGLWPNREACGINYGNCEHVRQQREFCNYPALPLDPEVVKQLSQVMPGTASCLERHEWFKHGTCQREWDPSQYFEVALELVRQFNGSGLNKYMAENMGKEVAREDFLKQVDTALGAGARERLELGCSGGNRLTDVFVNLPARIEPGASLTELIKLAPPDFRSRCPARFTIDAVGFAR
jgi:ribonuclease T2